ncbi:MAG: SPASM domain-containing protein, partial [Desulfobacteraceae bacterium]
CGNYVVVEHNGNVYSCDFFVEPEWKLGNIMQDNLTNMLNSSKQRKFGRLKSMLPEECRTCHWLHYCRGGCTKDQLHDTKSRKLNYLCNSYKMFFEHANARLKKMADDANTIIKNSS